MIYFYQKPLGKAINSSDPFFSDPFFSFFLGGVGGILSDEESYPD